MTDLELIEDFRKNPPKNMNTNVFRVFMRLCVGEILRDTNMRLGVATYDKIDCVYYKCFLFDIDVDYYFEPDEFHPCFTTFSADPLAIVDNVLTYVYDMADERVRSLPLLERIRHQAELKRAAEIERNPFLRLKKQ